MNIRNFTIFFFLFSILYLVFPKSAYAYLDPGTGSYFFQILIATVLGGIFAAKLFFKKIVNLLKNFLSKDDHEKPSAK